MVSARLGTRLKRAMMVPFVGTHSLLLGYILSHTTTFLWTHYTFTLPNYSRLMPEAQVKDSHLCERSPRGQGPGVQGLPLPQGQRVQQEDLHQRGAGHRQQGAVPRHLDCHHLLRRPEGRAHVGGLRGRHLPGQRGRQIRENLQANWRAVPDVYGLVKFLCCRKRVWWGGRGGGEQEGCR